MTYWRPHYHIIAHIVVSIPPILAVAECVRQRKGVSAFAINHMAGSNGRFKWQGGYDALSRLPAHGSPTESASADFHELRQGFSPPTPKAGRVQLAVMVNLHYALCPAPAHISQTKGLLFHAQRIRLSLLKPVRALVWHWLCVTN